MVGPFTFDVITGRPTAKRTNLLLSYPALFLGDNTPHQTALSPDRDLITAGDLVVSGQADPSTSGSDSRKLLSGGGVDSDGCQCPCSLSCRCTGLSRPHDDEEHSVSIQVPTLPDQSTMGIPPLAVSKLATLPHSTSVTAKQPDSISNFSKSPYAQEIPNHMLEAIPSEVIEQLNNTSSANSANDAARIVDTNASDPASWSN